MSENKMQYLAKNNDYPRAIILNKTTAIYYKYWDLDDQHRVSNIITLKKAGAFKFLNRLSAQEDDFEMSVDKSVIAYHKLYYFI